MNAQQAGITPDYRGIPAPIGRVRYQGRIAYITGWPTESEPGTLINVVRTETEEGFRIRVSRDEFYYDPIPTTTSGGGCERPCCNDMNLTWRKDPSRWPTGHRS